MKVFLKILSVMFLLTNLLSAQSLAGYKICIDPGHGGHDPANDRHILPPDFWESEGNFGKALHVKAIMESWGAEVILTRNGNDDSDDIALSQRAAIANANNVDFFESIHSNATGASSRVNFPLILFRGYDNAPVYPESKTFAAVIWQKIYQSRSGVWSYHNQNIRGDWSFYPPEWGTSGLGVLRPLTMPGVLSEGSFHDYIPEAWRLKNDYYLRNEAWAVSKAFLEYFNGGVIPTGIIAGIVRDPDKNVPTNYQPLSGTNEKYQPVNYLNIRVEPGSRVFFGDTENNGYYFFDGLEPGQYTIYIGEDFHESDTAVVTVQANKSTYYDSFISEIPNYNPPVITGIYPQDNQVEVGTRDTIKIHFDLRMDRSSTQSAFSITPNISGQFIWLNQDKTLAFFPLVPFEQMQPYNLAIATGAKTVYQTPLETAYSFNFTTGAATPAETVSHFPADGAVEVSNLTQIAVEFDVRMNDITTEDAFSISPAVNGSFSWNDNFTTMYFNPSEPMTGGSIYTVKIDTAARTYYGGYLLDELVFSFTTRSKLNLISSYPQSDAEDISTTVLIRAQFELPILSTSLPGNVLFYDSTNTVVSVRVNTSQYSKGIIEFEPEKELMPDARYKIVLKEGISDIENIKFGEELLINFQTETPPQNIALNSVDDFESIIDWLQPVESDSTTGINIETTKLTTVTSKKISGSSSGKLDYFFEQSEGLIELKNKTFFDLGNSSNTKFGLWVFGDLSGNTIELWFKDEHSSTFQIILGAIDWTGWKYKSIFLGDLNIQGNIYWGSIAVRKKIAGSAEGTIYFDNIVSDVVTFFANETADTPSNFLLNQNYPNPFNPSTVISYRLSSKSKVNLRIFDILGREIAVLIDEIQNAGEYNVRFSSNSLKLSSGIYFYSVEAEGFDGSNFRQTRKMILLK